jgi:hypothetical protein
MEFNKFRTFKDFDYKIYRILEDQNIHNDDISWKELIIRQDIGIIHISLNVQKSYDMYKIVDEKKWALAKIKYGF